MNFRINEVFEGMYPPEAAQWCNKNNAYIIELESINKDDKGNDIRRFQIKEIPPLTEEELKEQALENAKYERKQEVSKIVVEVDGMSFDGNEDAQSRMSRVVSTAVALGYNLDTTQETWVLADDTVATVTIRQLAQALKLAGEKQTELWTVPYQC